MSSSDVSCEPAFARRQSARGQWSYIALRKDLGQHALGGFDPFQRASEYVETRGAQVPEFDCVPGAPQRAEVDVAPLFRAVPIQEVMDADSQRRDQLRVLRHIELGVDEHLRVERDGLGAQKRHEARSHMCDPRLVVQSPDQDVAEERIVGIAVHDVSRRSKLMKAETGFVHVQDHWIKRAAHVPPPGARRHAPVA
jgi:hypothetical protein